jgi:hypothetical protein
LAALQSINLGRHSVFEADGLVLICQMAQRQRTQDKEELTLHAWPPMIRPENLRLRREQIDIPIRAFTCRTKMERPVDDLLAKAHI